MRLAAALVLLAALAVTASALAAPHDPTKRLTAADNARAKRALIRASDLGAGWKSGPPMKDDGACAGFSPDESAFVLTGEAYGPTLTHSSGAIIASASAVFQSAEHVRRDWALTVRPELMRCVVEGVKGGAGSDSSVKVRVVSTKRLSFPKVAPLTAVYRVVLSMSAGARAVPFTTDYVLVGTGRYELMLAVAQLGTSVPRDAELALARLLVERTRS